MLIVVHFLEMDIHRLIQSHAHTQILKVLLNTTKAYAVREIISLAEVANRSASNVLKNLTEQKLVEKEVRGQEIIYKLVEKDDRKNLLLEVFSLFERYNIKSGAVRFSDRATKIIPTVKQLQKLARKAKDSRGYR